MFNDANFNPTLPGRLVDRNRVTVNPETGDVIETGGHVNLDPVIITGKMPDNLKRTINKNIESKVIFVHKTQVQTKMVTLDFQI